MERLREKYGIKIFEEQILSFIRLMRGTNNLPGFIKKRTKKIYKWNDNLSRYWYERYYKIPIGKYSYGYQQLNTNILKSVGAFTSIAHGQFLVPNTHKMEFTTTSPILSHKMFGFIDKDIVYDYAPDFENSVIIGNDVWIGANCIIFDGVTIGDGAVIGAGSIIRRNVPPYAVVVGVDRIIRYRFSQEIIDKLLKIQWWNWSDDKIRENIKFMYDIKKFVNKFYKEQ